MPFLEEKWNGQGAVKSTGPSRNRSTNLQLCDAAALVLEQQHIHRLDGDLGPAK